MIVLRTEERLVDGPAREVRGGALIVVEHVEERVLLRFQPELVMSLDITSDAVHGGLAGADDHARVIGKRDGSRPILDFANEEVVPGSETAVRLCGFGTDVCFLELATVIVLQRRQAYFAEPAAFLLV